MIPRVVLFDESQENPARKKPATGVSRMFRCGFIDEEQVPKARTPKRGVSRLFRCWLFDEELELKARIASAKPSVNVGGIFTLEPLTPKKKKKKAPRLDVATAASRPSLVSFLPVPDAATPPVEDPSPAIKRARRVREVLLLAAAGSSPYRR